MQAKMMRPLLVSLLLFVCLATTSHARDIALKSLHCHPDNFHGSLNHKSTRVSFSIHEISHIGFHVFPDCSASFVIGDGKHHRVYTGKAIRLWNQYELTRMNGNRVYAKISPDEDSLFFLDISLDGQQSDLIFAIHSFTK
jgi:hypothetical protein